MTDIPLQFLDKETLLITIHDVYVEGEMGVMYTDREVYAPIGLNTDVRVSYIYMYKRFFGSLVPAQIPRDFHGAAMKTVAVAAPVVSLLHPNIGNHYHFMSECLSRLVLTLQHLPAGATLLMPSRGTSPHLWEALELAQYAGPTVAYEPGPHVRYHFATLHRVQWAQPVPAAVDPEQNDLWSDYLPSRVALSALIAWLPAHAHAPAPAPQRAPVVYLTRSGVRAVLHEELVVAALRRLLGANLLVFGVDQGVPGSTSLARHAHVFRHAQVVVGPHGAGLTNMLFAAPGNVSVVEFPMEPHCNRCFGYLAMALGIDYWVVPEVCVVCFSSTPD